MAPPSAHVEGVRVGRGETQVGPPDGPGESAHAHPQGREGLERERHEPAAHAAGRGRRRAVAGGGARRGAPGRGRIWPRGSGAGFHRKAWVRMFRIVSGDFIGRGMSRGKRLYTGPGGGPRICRQWNADSRATDFRTAFFAGGRAQQRNRTAHGLDGRDGWSASARSRHFVTLFYLTGPSPTWTAVRSGPGGRTRTDGFFRHRPHAVITSGPRCYRADGRRVVHPRCSCTGIVPPTAGCLVLACHASQGRRTVHGTGRARVTFRLIGGPGPGRIMLRKEFSVRPQVMSCFVVHFHSVKHLPLGFERPC